MSVARINRQSGLGGRPVLSWPFSPSGSYLASMHQEAGREVGGLVPQSPDCPEGLETVKVDSMDFSKTDESAKALDGADVFCNT
ncbi:MAG: hypothetical protein LBP92_11810 [Deltaproteobacteria bacterium]|jgi:hypothetical protein|nr:hypothetical protein [Deltaproteobacteria bacterium]